MSTRRVGDLPYCTDTHHEPAQEFRPNGIYEHICPKCGTVKRFAVDGMKRFVARKQTWTGVWIVGDSL